MMTQNNGTDQNRRSGMGRFDFSKTSQRATNGEDSEFSDRHGNNIVKDRFGNRHLQRTGETKDFSYQDKYDVELSTDESGVLTANVHMDQDPVIDKIIDGVEGMLRFHKTGDGSKIRQLMSGDLADQFEKEIASDDEDKERRISSMEQLVSLGRRYQRERDNGEQISSSPPPPSPSQKDRFLEEFMSSVSENSEMTRSSNNGGVRSAMLCNSCNGEVSRGMRFCPNCGAHLV